MQFVTVTSKVHKLGGSWCLILPRTVREALGLIPGDVMVIRIFGRRAVIAKFDGARALPITEDEKAAAAVGDARSRGA